MKLVHEHQLSLHSAQGSKWSQSNLGSSSVDAAGSRSLVGLLSCAWSIQVVLLERGDTLHLRELTTSAQRAGLQDISLCLTLNHPTD